MKRPNPAPGGEFGRSGPFLSNSPVTIIPDFLGSALCRRVQIAMDLGGVEPAEILDDGPALDRAARRASIIEVDPATLAAVEARLDAARDGLSASCGVPLGRREGASFIRYSHGGFYRPHRDRAHDADWPGAAARRIAVVVFLNAGFEGGELVIYPEAPGHDTSARSSRTPRLTPHPGSLVAFDAARLHEVRP